MNKVIRKTRGLVKSLTAWLNAMAASLVPLLIAAKEDFPLLKSSLTADLYKYAFIAIIVLNILVRFKTNKDLADK